MVERAEKYNASLFNLKTGAYGRSNNSSSRKPKYEASKATAKSNTASKSKGK